jgi:hypothetical protein
MLGVSKVRLPEKAPAVKAPKRFLSPANGVMLATRGVAVVAEPTAPRMSNVDTTEECYS